VGLVACERVRTRTCGCRPPPWISRREDGDSPDRKAVHGCDTNMRVAYTEPSPRVYLNNHSGIGAYCLDVV